jgi:predicted DsbA family dithiol-disulfide isomerase
VGYHRLMRLRDEFDLRINWRLIEIHPETSPEGEPVASLEYPSEQWSQLMQNLEAVAKEEGIAMADHSFTTNSKDALLLSEAAKEQGREKFYALHEKLFAAFFVDSRNIGDRNILRELAAESGIENNVVEAAWQDSKYQQRIVSNYHAARQHQIQGVPSFIFGERKLTGVVSEKVMRSAASDMVKLNVG